MQKQLDRKDEEIKQYVTELSAKSQQIMSQQEGSKHNINKFQEQEASKAKMISEMKAKIEHLERENMAVKEAMDSENQRLQRTHQHMLEQASNQIKQ